MAAAVSDADCEPATGVGEGVGGGEAAAVAPTGPEGAGDSVDRAGAAEIRVPVPLAGDADSGSRCVRDCEAPSALRAPSRGMPEGDCLADGAADEGGLALMGEDERSVATGGCASTGGDAISGAVSEETVIGVVARGWAFDQPAT